MKRIPSLLLAILAGTAQAGPAGMWTPMAAYGSPYGGYGTPFGNALGGGFGGGYGSPLGNLNTLNALGALASLGMLAAPVIAPLAPTLLTPVGQMGYPAMQMAPNMMSYSHYYQYGGGPFGGNPYLRPSLPNPMAPPAFSPSVPTLPFSPAQGTLPLPFAAPSPSPFPSPLPFMASPTPMPGAGIVPGLTPMAPSPSPQSPSNPWSKAPAQPQGQPQTQAGSQPMGNPWMMWLPVPQPGSAPAQSAPAAEATPMDPAAFLQRFMKPAETRPAPEAK
jgi:hypothetical protein